MSFTELRQVFKRSLLRLSIFEQLADWNSPCDVNRHVVILSINRNFLATIDPCQDTCKVAQSFFFGDMDDAHSSYSNATGERYTF